MKIVDSLSSGIEVVRDYDIPIYLFILSKKKIYSEGKENMVSKRQLNFQNKKGKNRGWRLKYGGN